MEYLIRYCLPYDLPVAGHSITIVLQVSSNCKYQKGNMLIIVYFHFVICSAKR